MPTYAIGDVQGCYDELQMLLEKIKFDQATDELWITGDLVNRGPKSLDVLRFVKQLPRVKVVLGNHDIHLIALSKEVKSSNHTLAEILVAPDRVELINWLRQQPLLHYDSQKNFVMTHAGILPSWDLTTAQHYAREVEDILQSDEHIKYIQFMYGDEPKHWRDSLHGWGRWRFIINAFTRMRFCTQNSVLDFTSKEDSEKKPPGYMPWFKVPNRAAKDVRIIFGHWAALQGKVDEKNIYALDTGCVWGGSLTAMCLEDEKRYSVPALRSYVIK